jgi:hypothetical protein
MHRLREHERKKEDIYEDLPLFVIERDYGSTEAGKTLASQGCKIMFFLLMILQHHLQCSHESLVIPP